MKSGIYEIINTVNNKRYIGSSKDVSRRLMQHLYCLRGNRHCNTYLQNSFNKYGEKLFKFLVIEYCSEGKMICLEIDYIEKYKCFDLGFGFNIRDPHMITMAEETKMKISVSMVGVNTWTKGVKRPVWVVDILRKSLTGLKRSNESKIRYSQSKMGEKNPMSKITNSRRMSIISEYRPRIFSYGKLAIKYGLSRSGVQRIIKNNL